LKWSCFRFSPRSNLPNNRRKTKWHCRCDPAPAGAQSAFLLALAKTQIPRYARDDNATFVGRPSGC
jgi:hypothetical protein